MSALLEESSDDEIGMNLQLAERLRLNRCEQNFSDRKIEGNQDFKQFFNMRRKKLSRDNQSSSSSSLEIQNDASVSGAASPYMLPNKKRQNGDKVLEQFTNPKRTCPSDRFRKTSEWRESKKKSSNNGAHYVCTKVNDSTFPFAENSAANVDLYPDNTYEDHLNNLADAEDSDLDISPQTSRNFQKGICQNPNLLKSNYQQSSSSNHGADLEYHETPAVSNCIQYVDCGSDDDAKVSVRKGALKGGRQSPDLIFCNKKVLGRKVKKVLDSDDTDEDNWPTGYRNRPLVFSSSDSEDSRNPNNENTLDGIPNETSSNSFPYRDAYKHNDHSSVYYRSASNSHSKHPQASRSPCPSTSSTKPQNFPSDDCSSQFLLPGAVSDFQSSVSVKQPFRACKSNRINTTLGAMSKKIPDGFPTNRSSPNIPRRGRSRMNGSERHVLRSGSPHPRTMHGQSRAENTKLLRDRSRSANVSYSQDERMSLADAYPDLFDAEDSSEVEFFTANSYSDTETSTESLGGLTINATFVGTPDTLTNTEIVCEHSVNLGSSEDEISVVFSTAPHSRNNEQRRGTSRALGRRYGRGRDSRHLQRAQEVVSLSPDPVEQVRQVEEDERFARMLQAEFDAEVDSDYSSRLYPPAQISTPVAHITTPVDSDDDIIDPVGDSDSDGMFATLFPFVHAVVPTARRGRSRRISSRPGTPNNFPQALFFHNRRRDIPNRRRYGGTDHRWQFARLLGLSPTLISLENTEDDYEAFLGLAEINGEVVPRGLQRAQINRLPTRKYLHPSSSSSSCHSSEVTHKRTELNKECQVCLSDYENGDVLRILPCFHEFHTPCIDPWLKINHTCPVCRVIVDLEE